MSGLGTGIHPWDEAGVAHIAQSFDLAAPEAERFDFNGHGIRAVLIDGEAWFVAVDVAAVLGYSATSAMTRSLDDDEKGMRVLHTLGGRQEVTVLSEPGLFTAIMRSRVEAAREFRRWVTHEVLPSIRRAGAYVAPSAPELSRIEILTLALESERRAIAAEASVSALVPRAEAWDELASAGGDYEVADAAKMLARAGVETGPQRLFDTLGDLHWTYRGGDRRWRAYADVIDRGYLTERAMPPRLNGDGELVPVAPQVRVTARGLERLRIRLGKVANLRAVEVSA